MKKLAIPVLLTVLLSIPAVYITREINWLAEAASEEAATVDYLILLCFDIAAVIFVLCMVFLVYSLVVFRRQPGDMSDGAHFHSHHALEIAWTVIPTAIVMWLWWLGIQEANAIGFGDSIAGTHTDGALVVNVTGQQWIWEFEYEVQPDSSSGVASMITETFRSPVLVLPVDEPVDFRLESVDVMHSFWVPELRMKMDTIPGRTNHIRLTPNKVSDAYKVRCAELCGTSHANMRADVRIVDAAGFQDWLYADVYIPVGDPAEEGAKLSVQYGCTACHSIDGTGIEAGKVGPSWKDLWNHERQLEDGSTVVADEEYIRNSIIAPGGQVVNGYNGAAMPANFEERFTEDFGGVDEPIGYIRAYIESLDTDG
jgi:cytochrome c oxidase subunit 2